MGRVDFFVSYNRADRTWAEWIAWQLEADGYTTKIQAWDFGTGSNFVHEMDQATKEAERTLLVLSPDYLTSRFTAPEWYAAFAQDPTGEQRKLVPVRVRECDLTGLLAQIVYLDLVGTDVTVAKTRLLSGVQRGRAKPATAPVFPGGPTKTAMSSPATSEPRFPGQLPDVFQVPHLRNPEFTGRAQLLQDLHTALTAGTTATIVQTVHGMGGVGKTQTAVEYAYRFGHAYEGVWWLNVETVDGLTIGLAALAVRVGLVPAETPVPAAEAAGREWLRTNGERWLLIYDNATAPQAVRDHLPHGGGCRVLLTSRHPHWKSIGAELTVRVWDRPESLAYLRTRTALEDPRAADELCHELGDLPLALAQATGYIRETGETLGGYLKLFRTRRQALWQQETGPDGDARTIATIWAVALQQLTPAAAGVLRLCAGFAPEVIPGDVLTAGAEDAPAELREVLGDPLRLNGVKREVSGYGLAEVSPEGLTLHRLVQLVIRDQLPVPEQERWCQAAGTLLRQSFRKSDDPRDWPGLRARLPHAVHLADALEKQDRGAAGYFLNEAGLFQRTQGAYAAARVLLQRAVQLEAKADNPDQPTLATYFSNLALIEQDLGHLDEARRRMLQALTINEQAYAPDHPVLARDYNNLALIEQDLGHLDEARRRMLQALAIDEQAYAPDHPTLAIRYSNLALIEKDLGNLDEARRRMLQAHDIDEQAYAPDHPTLAVSYSNLAMIEQDLGQLDEARRRMIQALAIEEQAYAPDHPTLAVSYNNLAAIEQDLGHRDEARRRMRQAHAIAVRQLPPDHPHRRGIEQWLKEHDPDFDPPADDEAAS